MEKYVYLNINILDCKKMRISTRKMKNLQGHYKFIRHIN